MTAVSLHRPHGSLRAGDDPLVLTPDRAGWTYAGLQVVSLPAGGERRLDLGKAEAAVVPLSGSWGVETDDGVGFELAGRADVFSAVPDLCYLPQGTGFTLSSPTGGEAAVATAFAHRRGSDPFYRSAEEVETSIRGAGQASRQITELLGAGVEGPVNLIVVEVHTPEGNWSSYPPHKHDEWSDDEVPLEEIYYFRIRGNQGFGIHRTYTTDGEIDDTVAVADGDVFLIPRGFHGPCVAAPGYDMYYLNVMAGPGEERAWRICTDPTHAWLWEVWQGRPPDPRLPMTRPRGKEPR